MIQGEEVNLRAVERGDAARLHGWLNEPAVARGWGWSAAAVSLAEVGRRVEGWLEEEAGLGRPAALIVETLAGEAVGLVVVAAPERPEARAAELSLLIGEPARWGRGLGSDALRTALEACFGGWGLRRVSVRSEAGNARAHRIYERCGFRREGRLRGAAFLDGRAEDVLLFGLLAEEWGEGGGEGGVAEGAEGGEGSGAAERAGTGEGLDASGPKAEGGAAQDPTEPFDVLSADGTATGRTKARAAVHRDGDWHRAIHVWIAGRDARGEGFLLVQRRGAEKDTWPGRLDATVGGHLRAGEGIPEALREIEEELGVAVSLAGLRRLGTRRAVNEMAPGMRDRELQEVFLLRDDRPLAGYRPNAAELAALVRLPLAGLLALFSGQAASVAGDEIEPGGTAAPATFTGADFVPAVDDYVHRVAIAAAALLRGERHVAI